MTLEDWSRTSDETMSRLFAAEATRWRTTLSWDYEDTSRQLAHARRRGLAPGLVARDAAGEVVGWTFFLRHGAELQIGALAASSPDVTAALADGVLQSAEAAGAERALVFGFTDAAGVTDVLAARGFDLGTYRYLERRLGDRPAALTRPAPSTLGRRWADTDLADAASLLQSAYPDRDPLRPFGGSGSTAEWLTYVRALTTTSGCGVFLPGVSVVETGRANGLDGLALVTRVSGDTVHLAQLAVRGPAQGQGLGRRLLGAVLEGARQSGFGRLTLLVSDRNVSAGRLYERAGFADAAAFVSASRTLRVPSLAGRPATRAQTAG